jgi:hypothetical protein
MAYNGTGSFDAQGRMNGLVDSNGNQITVSSTGWTDSVGRVIPGSFDLNSAYGLYFDLVSGVGESQMMVSVPTSNLSSCPTGTTVAREWDVPAFGGTATYYLCYSNVTFQTNFGEANVTERSPITEPFLSAIVLPNGRS